jgi:hypothetical protein
VDTATLTAADPIFELLGVREEEYDSETTNERRWLDTHRYGLRDGIKLDFGELIKDIEMVKEYDIPRERLRVFQEFADDFGTPIGEYIAIIKEMAREIGIPLKELIPHMQGQIMKQAGEGTEADGTISSLPAPSIFFQRPIISSSKIKRPLPPGKTAGKTILISVLQEPRITIRNSEWATRGWTYQEGVLSNRRLVFTEQQVYWECRGMAVNEMVDFPL